MPAPGCMSARGDLQVCPGDVVRQRSRFRKPRQFGTPGEFNWPRHLRSQGIVLTTWIREASTLNIVARRPSFPRRHLYALRRAVGQFIQGALTGSQAALTRALAAGRGENAGTGDPEASGQGRSQSPVCHFRVAYRPGWDLSVYHSPATRKACPPPSDGRAAAAEPAPGHHSGACGLPLADRKRPGHAKGLLFDRCGRGSADPALSCQWPAVACLPGRAVASVDPSGSLECRMAALLCRCGCHSLCRAVPGKGQRAGSFGLSCSVGHRVGNRNPGDPAPGFLSFPHAGARCSPYESAGGACGDHAGTARRDARVSVLPCEPGPCRSALSLLRDTS